MLLLVAFRIAGSRPTPTASSRAVGALVLQLLGMVSFSEFFRIESGHPSAAGSSAVAREAAGDQRPVTNDQRPVTASPVHHDGTGAGPRPSYGWWFHAIAASKIVDSVIDFRIRAGSAH